jgi:hypothetical protein
MLPLGVGQLVSWEDRVRVLKYLQQAKTIKNWFILKPVIV